MRILSLLPAATEIVYLLGLEKNLVGVSHECDFPAAAKKKPQVTFSAVSNKMSSRQIDKQVKKLAHRGPGVFHIEEGVLEKLKPDLILTQELCQVCAVGFNQVKKAARVLDGEVKIISLEPESVEDILENISLVGRLIGREQQANKAVKQLQKRIENYKLEIKNSTNLRVLVVEWLDPIMVAGHWVPEMIKLAGGRNLITKRGEKSKTIKLDQIKLLRPDILIFSPCSFDIDRAIREKKLIDKIIRAAGVEKVFIVDGNSYMTRPGPRIVDGIEILAEVFHPEVFKRKHTQRDWVAL